MAEALTLYYKPWTMFWIIESLGLMFFVLGLIYKFSFYFKGEGRSLYNQLNYRMMVKSFIQEVVLQKQIAKRSLLRWYIHMSIFYGFMGLLLLSAIAVVLETVIPETSQIGQYMLNGQGHNYYKAGGDLFGLILFLGLCLAFLRRFVFRSKQLNTDISDTTTLVFLLLLVITGFLLEALRISLLSLQPELQYSFIAIQLAKLFRGKDWVPSFASLLWTTHAFLTAALLAYFPHSKFLHIINSPVQIVLNASEERMRGDLYI